MHAGVADGPKDAEIAGHRHLQLQRPEQHRRLPVQEHQDLLHLRHVSQPMLPARQRIPAARHQRLQDRRGIRKYRKDPERPRHDSQQTQEEV